MSAPSHFIFTMRASMWASSGCCESMLHVSPAASAIGVVLWRQCTEMLQLEACRLHDRVPAYTRPTRVSWRVTSASFGPRALKSLVRFEHRRPLPRAAFLRVPSVRSFALLCTLECKSRIAATPQVLNRIHQESSLFSLSPPCLLRVLNPLRTYLPLVLLADCIHHQVSGSAPPLKMLPGRGCHRSPAPATPCAAASPGYHLIFHRIFNVDFCAHKTC